MLSSWVRSKTGLPTSSRWTSPSRTPAPGARPNVCTCALVRAGHGGHERVVGVEHGATVRGQGLDELALGHRDLGLGAELADVRLADVEHQRDVGRGDRAQLGEVADPACAHLQDEEAGPVVGAQHGQRQAQLVVERPGGGHGGRVVGQHPGQHVLRGGLALGPGDGDHRERAAALAPPGEDDPRELLECGLGVVDEHGGHPGGSTPQDRGGAALDRPRCVVVAVHPLTREGDEQAAGLGAAAVQERWTGDLDPGRGVDDGAAHDGRDLLERQGDHDGAPRSARAARTSSRSSNGCTTPAISWPVSCPLPAMTTTSPVLADAIACLIAVRRSPISTTSAAGRGLVDPGEHRCPDRGGVLGAGVVVGDHEHVGQARADLPHQRPLARVAVAPGADDQHQPTLGERSQRRQRRLDGVGLVRVVDDRQEVLAGVDLLEPARHPAAAGDAVRDQSGVEPGLARQRDGAQRVADVERAGQGDPRRDALARRA